MNPVVSCKWKYVHEVLVNRLLKLAQEKSVVRWTDRPDLTIAVDWEVKQQNKQTTAGRASPVSLCCGPWASHIYPSLVLVQPRKTGPCLTEGLLMWGKESNQTNKQKPKVDIVVIGDGREGWVRA